MSIQVFLRGYKLPYTSSFFTSSPLTLISVNSKVNSKVLSICVNMLKHPHAPTHLLSFTIFWCIFIVYTSINGLIQCTLVVLVFAGIIFSHFSRFLPKITKICTREIFNFVETAKINTCEKNWKKPWISRNFPPLWQSG